LRKSVGRPLVNEAVERLVVRMARENRSWGYDRIVGALANLEYKVSEQTVGDILKRHDIPPAPKRKNTTSWKDFIRAHMAVMVGTDFFTVEVLTLRGLKTFYVLFFLHLESRRICLAGITRHPDQEWMEQMARNVTMEETGFLAHGRYLLHDWDGKYCPSFCHLIETARVTSLALPPRSPNLNAFAERWVRSVKEECLSKLIFWRALAQTSLASLRVALSPGEESSRKGQPATLFSVVPAAELEASDASMPAAVGCLLKYYEREAA